MRRRIDLHLVACCSGMSAKWDHRKLRLPAFSDIFRHKKGIVADAGFCFNPNVPAKNVCDRNNLTTDLRLRLLSNSKLVISRNGHGSRHAHIGRARKRSVEGIPVPELGRE